MTIRGLWFRENVFLSKDRLAYGGLIGVEVKRLKCGNELVGIDNQCASYMFAREFLLEDFSKDNRFQKST